MCCKCVMCTFQGALAIQLQFDDYACCHEALDYGTNECICGGTGLPARLLRSYAAILAVYAHVLVHQ